LGSVNGVSTKWNFGCDVDDFQSQLCLRVVHVALANEKEVDWLQCNIGGREYCHVADYLFGLEPYRRVCEFPYVPYMVPTWED
jgi:hypothetical protein